MTIGFSANGTQAIPDKNLKKSSSPRKLMAKFGDGYEQRIIDGINSIQETFSVSFVNRGKEFIDDIVAFFDEQAGVIPFSYTYPDSNDLVLGETTIQVVCETYDLTYINDEFYNCTATFRRVYEP